MIEIDVCVGSSCHIRGSAFIINALKDYIHANQLGKEVELRASFCMGECKDGVCMKIDGEKIKNVTPANIRSIFEEKVLLKLEQSKG